MGMWRLIEALNLSEEQATRVFPTVNRFQTERQPLRREKRELLWRLRDALYDRASEEEISAVVGKLDANLADLCELRMKQWSELREVLTPEQQAKSMLFREEARRRARRHRHPDIL